MKKAVIAKFWLNYQDALKNLKKGFKIIPVKSEKQKGFLVVADEVFKML